MEEVESSFDSTPPLTQVAVESTAESQVLTTEEDKDITIQKTVEPSQQVSQAVKELSPPEFCNYTCDVCGRNLYNFDTERRNQHVNVCFDKFSKENPGLLKCHSL
jgi:hypothetical protein